MPPAFDVEKVFTYHAPHGTQPQRYEEIRAKAREFAGLLTTACPESREKSLALTTLQQTVMWANASIAIHEAES
jgi:hypothetical protein